MLSTNTQQTQAHQTHQFRAMGCQIRFWLATPYTAVSQAKIVQAEQLFCRTENQLSRFLPDSELSRFNRQSGQWVAVSPLFWAIIVAAVQAAAVTGGLFDPTLAHALVHAGYDRSFADLAAQNRVLSPTTKSTKAIKGAWATIELDIERKAVRVPEGVALDFGGIAKGYTAVLASRLLSKAGPNLVSAGGDLTAGDAPAGQPGWPVGIADPYDPTRNLVTLWLVNASLATSGLDYRRWQQHGGREAHHIIDPRTGMPAQTDLLTATVWHPSAIVAETWATAVLVAGKARGLDMLADYNMAALLTDPYDHLTLSWAMEPLVHWPTSISISEQQEA
jgi:thiamine biosynthesis lipoprotein